MVIEVPVLGLSLGGAIPVSIYSIMVLSYFLLFTTLTQCTFLLLYNNLVARLFRCYGCLVSLPNSYTRIQSKSFWINGRGRRGVNQTKLFI